MALAGAGLTPARRRKGVQSVFLRRDGNTRRGFIRMLFVGDLVETVLYFRDSASHPHPINEP